VSEIPLGIKTHHHRCWSLLRSKRGSTWIKGSRKKQLAKHLWSCLHL